MGKYRLLLVPGRYHLAAVIKVYVCAVRCNLVCSLQFRDTITTWCSEDYVLIAMRGV